MENISSVFKRVFKDILQEKKYIYCSKYIAFIRVIDNDLIQFVGLEKLGMYDGKGKKIFRIYAGVVSIYVEQLSNRDMMRYGRSISDYAYQRYGKQIDDMIIYDESSLENQMRIALENTRQYVYDTLFNCVDIPAYLNYLRRIMVHNLRWATEFKDDSLAMIKVNDHEDFISEFDETLAQATFMPEAEDRQRELYYSGMVQSTAGERDKVYNDPELYAAALKECEIRKERNLQTLRELKVIK